MNRRNNTRPDRIRRSLALATLWPLAAPAVSFAATAALSRSRFTLFDATAYLNKTAQMSQAGVVPLQIIGEAVLWPGDAGKAAQTAGALPDPQVVQTQLGRVDPSVNPLTVLDIERWPLTGAQADDTYARLVKLLALVRTVRPDLKYAVYGLPPIRSYWGAVAPPQSDKRKAWSSDNAKVSPLVPRLDAFTPSLYTFYDDRAGWGKYATENLKAARAFSPTVPLYPFIWPEYHDSNQTLGGTEIPADYWRAQLDLVRQYADGAIIWGGWNLRAKQRRQWDDNAAWWKSTRDFIAAVAAAPQK